MSAHDVQREIDVTSKSDVGGVGLSFRYVLLWTSFFFAKKLSDSF